MRIEEKKDEFVISDFNELEAYKIACAIEREGMRFYEKLFSSVRNGSIKEKLQFLLGEERKHLEFFEGRLRDIGQKIEDRFEEDDLLFYMEYGIFQPYKSIKDMPERIDDVKKALRLGIIVEDKSIKFYTACEDKVSSADAKKELANIVEEEKKHRALLESLLMGGE